MSPCVISPVDGIIGICPEIKMKLPALIAWEYGPIAAGAFFVDMTCFSIFLLHFL
jgi:hypothetical protein